MMDLWSVCCEELLTLQPHQKRSMASKRSTSKRSANKKDTPWSFAKSKTYSKKKANKSKAMQKETVTIEIKKKNTSKEQSEKWKQVMKKLAVKRIANKKLTFIRATSTSPTDIQIVQGGPKLMYRKL